MKKFLTRALLLALSLTLLAGCGRGKGDASSDSEKNVDLSAFAQDEIKKYESMGLLSKMDDEVVDTFYPELKKMDDQELLVYMCERDPAPVGDFVLARAALKNAGLLPFLSGVLSCSTLGFGKETPRVYHAARQQLGTALDTTWVFEDTALAIASAKSGGYHVVQINDPVRESQVGPVVTAADLNIFSYDQLPRPQGRP